MTATRNNRDANLGRRSEMRGAHLRRRAIALGAVALAAVFGPKLVSTDYHSITGTTTADKLAKPFDQVEAEVVAGKFSPGSVKEVNLPPVDTQSAYQDALALTGNNGAESKIDEVDKDIAAQQGDTPQALGGDTPVIVPTNDLQPSLQK